MSKIFEALQHADKEKREAEKSLTPYSPRESWLHSDDLDMGEEMLGLYKTLEIMLPSVRNKIIQFIGSREGEGTSTVAREFARACAIHIGKSALLLDADRHQPAQQAFFDVPATFGWVEAIQEGKGFENAFFRIGDSRLFLSPSCNSATSTPQLFDSCETRQFWKLLRERFDLILIDSPPLTESPDGLAFAQKADGVVIVVEAEKTRWGVVDDLKRKILKVNGRILGVVFNKRRYHIPRAIYRLL